jgi:hypothetical protein
MTDAYRKAPRLLTIRQLHAYVGMLIAPTVLFLAVTGVLQIYNLHEAHGPYVPAPIIEKLSSVHKDQVFKLKHEGGPPPPLNRPAPGAAAPAEQHHRPKLAVTLLKAYFACVAVALICSTCLGLWIALRAPLRRRTHIWLLAIGTVVPFALAALTG